VISCPSSAGAAAFSRPGLLFSFFFVFLRGSGSGKTLPPRPSGSVDPHLTTGSPAGRPPLLRGVPPLSPSPPGPFYEQRQLSRRPFSPCSRLMEFPVTPVVPPFKSLVAFPWRFLSAVHFVPFHSTSLGAGWLTRWPDDLCRAPHFFFSPQ